MTATGTWRNAGRLVGSPDGIGCRRLLAGTAGPRALLALLVLGAIGGVQATVDSALVEVTDSNPPDTVPVYEVAGSPATYLEVALTHAIYRYAEDPGLADVVVLDRQDNRLPSRVVAAVAVPSETRVERDLRFFPVAPGVDPRNWVLQGKTSVRIDEEGTSIRIDADHGTEAGASPDTEFYLVDLGEPDARTRLDHLTLEWRPDSVNRYLEVEVGGSRDLRQWSMLATQTLVDIRHDGQTLVRKDIPLAIEADRFKVLRLKFLRGGETLKLTQVVARMRVIGSSALPPPERWEVAGVPASLPLVAGDLGTARERRRPVVEAWEFRRDDQAPATTVALALGQSIHGDTLRLLSRQRERQDWRLVHEGLWFNQRVGDTWQHSDPIHLVGNRDRYWRLELHQRLREETIPSLVFEHPPRSLRFIANHNPPYRIAVQRGTAGWPDPDGEVFDRLVQDASPHWLSVPVVMLDPPPLDGEMRESTLPWPSIGFWTALVVAVSVLLVLAIRLCRQAGGGDGSGAG